jgi:pimeloyl-ACP methyl ester carboxylesterase
MSSSATREVIVGDARIAYVEEGAGPPVLLLHGCPFASFVWRNVIPELSGSFRCVAPDLLGLGDTETPAGADWSLRAQAATVLGLLDCLGIDRVHMVGHDHGGAIAQLVASEHPGRVDRLVLCNAEAYDNWPSTEERPFLRATQLPALGTGVLWLWSRRPLLRWALATGRAVQDRSVLDREFLDAYIRANLGDRRRRAKTRRFLAGQLDPANNRVTLELLDGLRRFDHPTLLLWGAEDPHFGPEWAERLAHDMRAETRLELLPHTGHLVMEEQPQRVATLIREFLTASQRVDTPARAG